MAIKINKNKIVKIGRYVVNVLSVLIGVFALILVIGSLSSHGRGYTSFFGYAFYVVESGSMSDNVEDEWQDGSFDKGDIIKVKLLKEDEKDDLEYGDVITFWDSIGGYKALNTHRIIEVIKNQDGNVVNYRTKGDANQMADVSLRPVSEVQGIYQGKASGAGKALIWMQSETGFIVCVMVPSMLLVVYCIVMVIHYGVQYGKKKMILVKEEAKEEISEDLKAQLRAELLREMQEQQKADGSQEKVEGESDPDEIKDENND